MRIPARGIALASLLALAGLPASPPAWAADPCAGNLAAANIVDCLMKPGADATTRGIRPTTAPVPAGRPAAAAPARPAGATVNLLVPFGYDSADLTADGTRALDALATALTNPGLAAARFEIAGHTDASGSADYNQRLSERRAEAARAYLIGKGIPAARLTAAGYGRTQLYEPASPNASVNRRVQVTRLD